MVIKEREIILDEVRYSECAELIANVLGGDSAIFRPLLPTWHWLFTHETPLGAKLGVDGHPETRPAGVPEHFVRRLWVDSLIEYGKTAIEFGQRLHLREKVGQAILKQGKSGELAFVPIELSISSGDAVVLEERRTGVYRPAPKPPGKPEVRCPAENFRDDADLRGLKAVSFTEIDLFRYSALLKVYHRIHYDAVYATGEEAYPGLLVHGPLLGQILVGHAVSLNPAFRVCSVAVSVRRPIFVNRRVLICIDVSAGPNIIKATAFDERGLPAMSVDLRGA